MQKIRVLVIDDSAVIRSVLSDIINRHHDMEVVGVAADAFAARDLIRSSQPDVLTLDVEMPHMDGLEFLQKLMQLRPVPVIMISALTEKGSDITLRALELGAVDYIAKPKMDGPRGLEPYSREIAEKIRVAAKAHPRIAANVLDVPPAHSADAVLPAKRLPVLPGGERLIIVGASTGGTEAIKEFLIRLPADVPGIVITQHMPEMFTQSFAKRLDSMCQIAVKEAVTGERIVRGHAYIAPGHSHLLVKASGGGYVTELSQAPPVNRHRPSVDVLFRSAANCVGPNAIGVILTGMGKDGAAGMLEMRQAGAYNLAQDEASCVVFGMPKEAIALGAVHEIVPLAQMAERVLAFLKVKKT